MTTALGAQAHPLPSSGVAVVVGFELGPWDQYLVEEITPKLERLNVGSVSTPAPVGGTVSWIDMDLASLMPDFARSLVNDPQRQTVAFTVLQSHTALDLGNGNGSAQGGMFRQSLLMPGVSHQFDERSTFTVSAVLATQHFGFSALDMEEADELGSHMIPVYRPYDGHSEVTHGVGARLAMTTEVIERVTLSAAFQSRIEMGEFAAFRGVHGTTAELDIPSRIQLGLEVQATPRSSFNLGASQIFFSEIGAFPGQALPARFNALLGDSVSPRFSWNDLTVYSVGWQWRHESDLTVNLDFRTRTQPKPSSNVLADALGPELASNAFLVGVTKGVGRNARLNLTAAYAAPEFAFGGNVLGVVTNQLDQDIEMQATWTVDF